MNKVISNLKKRTQRLKSLMIKYKLAFLIIFITGLVYDVFFNTRISGYFTAFLITLWCLNLFLFKIKPRKTFIMGATTYLLAFISQFFGKEVMMEKGASWLLIFLMITLVQWLIKNEKKA